MKFEALADARAATSVQYMFVDAGAAPQAIPAGHIAITFDHLPCEDLQKRNWKDIEDKVRAAQWGNRAGKGDAAVRAQIKSDMNWLQWFLGAQKDAVVVTRYDKSLWWACFDDSTVHDAGPYRYRQSRRGWQRIEVSEPKELLGFDTWLQTSRPTAANRTIEEFQALVHARHAAMLVQRDADRLASARVLAGHAFQAAQQSGKPKGGRFKIKGVEFESKDALVAHILKLFEEQDGRCKITGLTMVLHGSETTAIEHERLASLDRVSSNGNYAAANLQLLCNFINRWKGTSEDAHMKLLLQLVPKIHAHESI